MLELVVEVVLVRAVLEVVVLRLEITLVVRFVVVEGVPLMLVELPVARKPE